MRITEEFPFNDYRVYKVWHKKEQRYYAQLINKLDKSRTTITYAKYVLSIKLGRILKREEEVDHIDGDSLNDDINNLQILSKEDHFKKHLKQTNRKTVILICDYCGASFEREARQVKHKNNIHNFCSRSHQYNFMRG